MAQVKWKLLVEMIKFVRIRALNQNNRNVNKQQKK